MEMLSCDRAYVSPKALQFLGLKQTKDGVKIVAREILLVHECRLKSDKTMTRKSA
jgi:hypothetical protein